MCAYDQRRIAPDTALVADPHIWEHRWMRIRLATTNDEALLLKMRLAFLADYRKTTVQTFSEEFVTATKGFLAQQMQSETLRSWFAETDECLGVVSMLVFDMAPRPEDLRMKEGYIINMYVIPEGRGQGIGRHLLFACQEYAAVSGVRRLLLHATDDGTPLYRSTGFAINPRWMELPIDAP
jgi:GNAT superfamily N-acetyltransferase